MALGEEVRLLLGPKITPGGHWGWKQRGAQLGRQVVPMNPLEVLWAIIETQRKEGAHLMTPMTLTTPVLQ